MNIHCLLASILIFFSSFSSHAETLIQPLAVGGVNSSTLEAPWQVYIIVNAGASNYACGGSIIANQWVVTAAHCLNASSDDGIYVEAGPANVHVYSGNGNISNLNALDRYAVNDVQVHNSYNNASSINDIALLRLASSIKAPAAAIATLQTPLQTDLDNEANNGVMNNLVLTGWGRTSTDRQMATDILQKIELNAVSDNICADRWNLTGRQNFAQLYLCADAIDRGACSGDSGGPLVWQDKQRAQDPDRGYRLAGIVSFGSASQCADNSVPDVYTQVSSYQTWIASTIGGYVQPSSTFSQDIFASDFSSGNNDEEDDDSSGGSTGFSFSFVLFMIYLVRANSKFN